MSLGPRDAAATATGAESATVAEQSVYARLRGHLAYLRLDAAEALPAALDAARDGDVSHVAFLEQLLGAEVAATAARRHTARLNLAGFPAPWRLADFDFDAQPSSTKR